MLRNFYEVSHSFVKKLNAISFEAMHCRPDMIGLIKITREFADETYCALLLMLAYLLIL